MLPGSQQHRGERRFTKAWSIAASAAVALVGAPLGAMLFGAMVSGSRSPQRAVRPTH
jgi:hypothetical protein